MVGKDLVLPEIKWGPCGDGTSLASWVVMIGPLLHGRPKQSPTPESVGRCVTSVILASLTAMAPWEKSKVSRYLVCSNLSRP